MKKRGKERKRVKKSEKERKRVKKSGKLEKRGKWKKGEKSLIIRVKIGRECERKRVQKKG